MGKLVKGNRLDDQQLSSYLQKMVALLKVAKTIELEVYRKGYNSKSSLRNPYGIAPIGFEPAFTL